MNARISPTLIQYVGKDNIIDGMLPSYAWPGGYPLYYVTDRNTVLCPDHANNAADYADELIVAADVNWEDTSLWCEHGHLIAAAYDEDYGSTLTAMLNAAGYKD